MREISFHTDRGTIAALEWGDSGAFPVFALHGWLDNAASFMRLADQLADYHVIAIDLPGHGLSGHRSVDASYYLVDYVEDVLAVLDQLEWPLYHLLGHSLGASIASLVAVVDPRRVRSLLLIDGIGALSEEPADAPTRLALSMQKRRRKNSRGKLCYETLDEAVRARLKASDLSYESAELLVRRGTVCEDEGFFWRCDRRLLNPSPMYMTEDQVLEFLAAIEARTLLVQADHGILGNRPVTRGRIEAVRDLSLIHVAGGHHLHLDSPAATGSAIRAFLEADQPAE